MKISFNGFVQVLLICLKVGGIIDWSWWLVMFPILSIVYISICTQLGFTEIKKR